MKVKELIEELKKREEDSDVLLDSGQSDYVQGTLSVSESGNTVTIEADGDYIERG